MALKFKTKKARDEYLEAQRKAPLVVGHPQQMPPHAKLPTLTPEQDELKEFVVVRVSKIMARDEKHAKAKAIGANYWRGDDKWIVIPSNETQTT